MIMIYEKIFRPIEDIWMEKNNINQHVVNDDGSMEDFFQVVKIGKF
jgi:hypothetical protein